MNVAWIVLKRYAPVVTFPIAVVIGAIGYSLESYLREKKTQTQESLSDKRNSRRFNELTEDPLKIKSLKEDQYTNLLDRNLSPSLSKDK